MKITHNRKKYFVDATVAVTLKDVPISINVPSDTSFSLDDALLDEMRQLLEHRLTLLDQYGDQYGWMTDDPNDHGGSINQINVISISWDPL